jgi:hypothetical protein
MNLIIENSQLVEIPVVGAAAGKTYSLPSTIKILDGKKTYGIICHAGDVDYLTSQNGNNIMTVAELRQATLVLDTGGITPVLNLPLYQLLASNNGGFIRQFGNLILQISKCYIQLNNNSGFTDNDTFALTFIYH